MLSSYLLSIFLANRSDLSTDPTAMVASISGCGISDKALHFRTSTNQNLGAQRPIGKAVRS